MKTRSEKTPPLQQLLVSGVQAAEAAGKRLSFHFLKPLKIKEKQGAGLVTNADFEAQDQAVKILKKANPDFGFLTEEAKPEIKDGPGRWIIDPLDGTTNYVHGLPMFCVSIAAEWNGEVVVGIIFHPILKEMYTAIKGKGAFVNRQRLAVSKTTLLKNSLLSTGFHYSKGKLLNTEMTAFQKLSQEARGVRRPGSAALDLAYTARGVFDGFWERKLAPWDVAAGCLLVNEAGGKVTDFKGNPFCLEQKEFLASNGHIHHRLVAALNHNQSRHS